MRRLWHKLYSGKVSLLPVPLLALLITAIAAVGFGLEAAFDSDLLSIGGALVALALVPAVRRWWATVDPAPDFDELPDSDSVPGRPHDSVSEFGALFTYMAAAAAVLSVLIGGGPFSASELAEALPVIFIIFIALSPLLTEAEARIAIYRTRRSRREEAEVRARVQITALKRPAVLGPDGSVCVPIRRGRAVLHLLTIGAMTIAAGAVGLTGEDWVERIASLFAVTLGGFMTVRQILLYVLAPYLLRADEHGVGPVGAGVVPWRHVRAIRIGREDGRLRLRLEVRDKAAMSADGEEMIAVRAAELAKSGRHEAADALLCEWMAEDSSPPPTRRAWWTFRHRLATSSLEQLDLPLSLARADPFALIVDLDAVSPMRVEVLAEDSL